MSPSNSTSFERPSLKAVLQHHLEKASEEDAEEAVLARDCRSALLPYLSAEGLGETEGMQDIIQAMIRDVEEDHVEHERQDLRPSIPLFPAHPGVSWMLFPRGSAGAGGLALLAGEGGAGKSALMVELAASQLQSSEALDRPIGWINLDLPKREWNLRLARLLLGVPAIGQRAMTQDELDAATLRAVDLADHPTLWACHPQSADVEPLCALMEQWVARHGVRMVFIDGLFPDPPQPGSLDRSAALQALAEVAERHALPLVVSVQLPVRLQPWTPGAFWRQWAGRQPGRETLVFVRSTPHPVPELWVESFDSTGDRTHSLRVPLQAAESPPPDR